MNYLSLPFDSRLVDCSNWDHKMELFKARLAQWKARYLSLGGRLTLIKSVINSILIYALSVCILHVNVQNKLHGIMSKFLWGGSEHSNKLHLVN